MADYSEEERAQLAREGKALRDGSYPMKTCADVENARQAFGRAPENHRAALTSLINRRNHELSCGQPEFAPGT